MIRPLRHRTPLYIFNRVRRFVYVKTHPKDPWITPAMVKILDSWLRPTDEGLEWGSGRSTMWLAKRVHRLTTVEHDEVWARMVQTALRDEISDGRVIVKNEKDGVDNSASSKYVGVAASFLEKSLDFCLVDGKARGHCALACLPKIRSGGLVIVDNVERYLPRVVASPAPRARGLADGFASVEWEQFSRAVSEWRVIWVSDGISETACWIKP